MGSAQKSLYSVVWCSVSVVLIEVLGFGWQGRAMGQLIGAGTVASRACWSPTVPDVRMERVSGRSLLRSGFGPAASPHSIAAIIMGRSIAALNGKVGPEVTGQLLRGTPDCMVLSLTAAAVNQASTPWLYARPRNSRRRQDAPSCASPT